MERARKNQIKEIDGNEKERQRKKVERMRKQTGKQKRKKEGGLY